MTVRPESRESRRQRAQEIARACARLLKEEFGAREVYVFGSLAGQSPWHSRSDLDLAVEGLAPEVYFRALSALRALVPEDMEVDLVTLEDAPRELVARIKGGEGTAIMPEDPVKALKLEIENELATLERLVHEASELLRDVPEEPRTRDVRAAGSIVHDFYNGVERIFERIAVRLGPGLPTGPGWHMLLLRSMESAAEGYRPAVIDHALALRLIEYLSFRHLFRHSYGYELLWPKLRPLIEGMAGTLSELRAQLGRFLTALEEHRACSE